jgi:hypothetical protein
MTAGANFIDVNAGARIGHEAEDMKWLLDTIQPIVDGFGILYFLASILVFRLYSLFRLKENLYD